MDYASGKNVDRAEDFGWMDEVMAEEDARQLKERSAHKFREADRLLQGGAGDASGSEGAAQLEAASKDAAEDAVKDAPKDAAEHAEKNTGEHAAEHAQEKSEHRGELGQFFDNLVEHRKQRDNPEGEGYPSEGTDSNTLVSQHENSWMKDAKKAMDELNRANYPGAAAIGAAFSDFTKERSAEMLEAAKNDDWKSFQEAFEQTNIHFGEFRLREDWIEWVIKNQITERDAAAVLKRRENIEGRKEKGRKPYLEGDLTCQGFLKIKGEGGRLLSTRLHAIYADLDEQRFVGLARKDVFFTPILTMANRENAKVVPGERIVLEGVVETGQSRTPRPEGAAGGCATGLSGALLSPLPAFAG